MFTLAAGARSAVQLATKADEALFAYALSMLAAITYAAGWVAIRRASEGRTRFAARMLWVELGGVLAVGTLSIARPDWFPDATVWSGYGIGYGFVPAVLPILGLAWLRAQDPSTAVSAATASRIVALAEALSWIGLLVGMLFKHVLEAGEQGVRIFGPIHGTVVISYVIVMLLAWRAQRWSLPVAVVALGAAVPPLCTVLVEIWLRRTGRLGETSRNSQTGQHAAL